MAIQPIPTTYAGCRFRSRLEARWAVFFDHLDIAWQYEPQGYLVGPDQKPYLPDFHLPSTNTWVEVKGDAEQIDFELLAQTVDPHTGLPGMRDSVLTKRGLLLLGAIPHVTQWLAHHPILQHKTGLKGMLTLTQFSPADTLTDPWFWADPDVFFETTPSHPAQNEKWATYVRSHLNYRLGFWGGTAPKELADAYTAARSARFEHGEQG